MAEKACKDCHAVVDAAAVNDSGLCTTCAAKNAAKLEATAQATS